MADNQTHLTTLATVRVGDTLPQLVSAPISRTILALYCGASGDHNPIHVDIDFARRSGMDDVFAHGMLPTAYVGRLLTDWAPQPWLRSLQVRFVAITHVGDIIHCNGRVVAVQEGADGNEVRVEISAADQTGQVKIQGQAVFAVPRQ
ncbi:MAG: MaoC/PaaZ C-terminal domain-containing protein [Sterolibacterium sp.]